MRRLLLISVFLFISSTDLLAQNRTKDFEITLPDQKINNSLYNTVEYIDSRYDTTFMGIVQLGAFNKKARVVPETPFSIQIKNVLRSLTDNTSKDGKLLFQLRQFNFAELTGAMSEKGYCYIRAVLYAEMDGHYQKINSIDTVIFVRAMDVTRALFRKGSKTITDFISRNLLEKPSDSNYYSFADVIKMDSIEKRTIKVYNTLEYTDGVYTNYKSFMNQIPDKQIIIEKKNNKLVSMVTLNQKGKAVKIKANDVYAVVVEGEPFVATDYGFYLLKKVDDDFKFVGNAKVNANTGDVITANVFFGVIGGLIATNAQSTFEMKIDHISGGIIRLREINRSY
ncbi:MAG: hypothetical protein ABI237_14605 [Ginsengibacter sp.]